MFIIYNVTYEFALFLSFIFCIIDLVVSITLILPYFLFALYSNMLYQELPLISQIFRCNSIKSNLTSLCRKNSVQFSSVAQSCLTLCDPMSRSMPGVPVHHQLPEFMQSHVHRGSDAIQPFHPLSSPSPPAPNPSQHQSLFQCVNSLHEVAKVLEFQL